MESLFIIDFISESYAILIVIAIGLDLGISSNADNIVLELIIVSLKWIATLLMDLCFYLFISLLAWLFIGMPLSRIIEKHTNSGMLIYFGVSIILCLLIGLLIGLFDALGPDDLFGILFISIPIILQSTAYRFYLGKLMSNYK